MVYLVLTRSATDSAVTNFRLALVRIFASYQAFAFAIFPLSYRYYMLLKWVICNCRIALISRFFRNEKPKRLWVIFVCAGTTIAPMFQVTLVYLVLIPFVDKQPLQSFGSIGNVGCLQGARVPIFPVKETVTRLKRTPLVVFILVAFS